MEKGDPCKMPAWRGWRGDVRHVCSAKMGKMLKEAKMDLEMQEGWHPAFLVFRGKNESPTDYGLSGHWVAFPY